MPTNSSTSIQQVVNILAESLLDDPNFFFIFGNKTPPIEVLKAFFEPFITDAHERGKIILAPDSQGACVWYPAEVDIFNQQFEEILKKIINILSELGGKETAKRFEELIGKVGQHEPQNKHCEVFFIGLKPANRGLGLGNSLLKPVLDYADKKHVGCYLVSSNIRNISFYKRNGFEKYCSIKISDSYSMTGMWRNPY